MKRMLLGIAVALIPITLSACHYDEPPASRTAGVPVEPADQNASMYEGGAPNQEVALDYYSTLTIWAKDYPQLHPAIIHAFANDGIITYAEYDQISRQEQKLADDEGEKLWDAKAKRYRQALRKAAS